ncbi:MAG TPA: ABC transporter permease [Candidatus Korarchaeota archaeon]|nr:ABC transporter permease [Candidatus Korarchaeota archaeon]
MDEKDERKRITFSLVDAARLGYDNVKRRFNRASLNLMAIALGIAFFSSLYLMDAFLGAYTQVGGEVRVEGYQYGLMIVSLVVCAVSITNSILITVYERYKEIGTMKCLGALDQHVLKLFLVESFILAILGGSLGFFMGLIAATLFCAITMGFGHLSMLPLSVPLLLFGKSILISVTLSTIATIYPAYKAAKLDPVEALRYEV